MLLRRYFRRSLILEKVVKFKIPDPAEGIIEVEIMSWHKKVGDPINEFDVLADARCDKKNIEYKSDFTGTLKEIFFEEGDFAPVAKHLYAIEVGDDVDVPEEDLHEGPTEEESVSELP
jgi:pyruvate/2-oxoglutarate dehydrogenase complex dihydrolipoamide acyltransferase (E2) component